MKIKARKPLRMREYDYSLPGTYFITICTAEKKKILSKIVGAYHDAPVQIKLSDYGEIVKEAIERLPCRFNINIHNYVIMPDHIHILLEINACDRALHEAPLQERSIISQSIGYLKAYVTKEIRKNHPEEKLWQSRFYDHVIRNDKDYVKHYDYIKDNPVMWALGKHII